MLGLKITKMKQLKANIHGLGRFMLRDLCNDYDKE